MRLENRTIWTAGESSQDSMNFRIINRIYILKLQSHVSLHFLENLQALGMRLHTLEYKTANWTVCFIENQEQIIWKYLLIQNCQVNLLWNEF